MRLDGAASRPGCEDISCQLAAGAGCQAARKSETVFAEIAHRGGNFISGSPMEESSLSPIRFPQAAGGEKQQQQNYTHERGSDPDSRAATQSSEERMTRFRGRRNFTVFTRTRRLFSRERCEKGKEWTRGPIGVASPITGQKCACAARNSSAMTKQPTD
jgi:hypothetical protein